MYEDKTLKCKDCGEEFVFTAGEQEFYAEKGFQNEPQRCKKCRDASLQESTTLPSALSAARKQEFRLSRRTTDLYTAANATQLRDSNPTL